MSLLAGFVFFALAFLLLALLLVLPPLLRRKDGGDGEDAARREENIAAGRRRMRAIHSRSAAGEISAAEQEEYAREVENQLLLDMAPPSRFAGHGRDYLGVALVVAVLAFVPPALYFVVGAPAALMADAVAPSAAVPPSMEELTERLKRRIAADPQDSGALYWFGRLLSAQGEHAAAAARFRQARAVVGDEPDLLAAEAAALMHLPEPDTGEIGRLLAVGLDGAAEHTTLLWLAALRAEQRGDAQEAADYRRRARVSVADLPDDDAAGDGRQTGDASPAAVVVVVHHTAPAAAGTLAVFARAPAGAAPPLPLAVVRRAAGFPATVVLDNAATETGAKMGDFAAVDIVARWSGGGGRYGERQNTPPGATITIVIDRAVGS